MYHGMYLRSQTLTAHFTKMRTIFITLLSILRDRIILNSSETIFLCILSPLFFPPFNP